MDDTSEVNSAPKVSNGYGSAEYSGRWTTKDVLRDTRIHFFLIVAFGFLAYSNTFHSPFQFDDTPQIVENAIIRNLGNFISDWKGYDYNPRRFIGYLTFALNYYAGGLSVTGYHVVNLAIHITNAMLVYFLVLLTFRTPVMLALSESSSTSSPVVIALFAALLFVSHPVQTEAVTYIVQRFASLATLFYLLSLVTFVKGRVQLSGIEGAVQGGKQKMGSVGAYAARSLPFFLLSLVFAVLAMKTKETAFTLPILVVVYEFTFFKSSVRKKLLFVLPVLLTLMIIPLSLLQSNRPLGEILSDVSERTRVQTNISRLGYLMTEMRVICTYLRLMVLPVKQNLDYDYPIFHGLFTPQVALSCLVLFGLMGAAMYLLYASRPRKSHLRPYSPYYRLIGFGIVWFFVTLTVESSIVPIADVIFEHRLYLPSAGLLIAIATGMVALGHKLKREKLILAALVLITVGLSSATYARNTLWASGISLWEDTVGKSPDKARPHNNLGVAYKSKGQLDMAIEQFRAALRLKPDYADAHNNLGTAYAAMGLLDQALEQCQIALSINPGFPEALVNLGNVYAAKGLSDMAIGQYRRVLSLHPDYAEAYNNLGIAYAGRGLPGMAIEQYRRALSLNPDYAEAHFNLGNVYASRGLLDMAIAQYQRALSARPDYAEARNNLGNAYVSKGLLDMAIEQYRIVISLRPEYIKAYMNLGAAYDYKGLPEKAIEQYRTVAHMNPNNAEAHFGMARLYLKNGDVDMARTEFELGLKINPFDQGAQRAFYSLVPR